MSAAKLALLLSNLFGLRICISFTFEALSLHCRMALDLMRVDTADGLHRFAVSLAGYGYMGDLMQASERLRWMGPPRYTTAGAVTLFRGQVYHAKIAYKPADSQR